MVNFSTVIRLANGLGNGLGLQPCLSAQAPPPLPGLGKKPELPPQPGSLHCQSLRFALCQEPEPLLWGLAYHFTSNCTWPLHETGFLWVAPMLKNLPAMQVTGVQPLGWEEALEEEMATHSSILARRSPWTEEPGGQQSMVLQRVSHNSVTNTFTFHSA